eukprot:TRINITY_DN14318_c0_g1_i2.p3 TRINITY_DN14318_c0_g1~~TRINITY_DN14318_c0_g1_i2.p3  ORF type:complete len:115 (+),score=35.23 TRINITY_DN14318_c0_g1_i2:157-501(+)
MQRGLVGSEMCIRDRYILSALEKNTSLKNLNLAHNYLGATRWNYSLLKNPRLESLDLTQNNFLKKEFDKIVAYYKNAPKTKELIIDCLLYTSDAADDTPCVDLGGRRIIKKKNT